MDVLREGKMKKLNFTTLSLRNIKLSEIDTEDKRFIITYNENLTPLIRSIEEIGVINPPIVKESSKYIIVTGYKRIKACKEMGIKEIDVLITRKPDKECFFINFYENLGTRVLNEIEKAESIKRLINFVTTEEIVKNFLPLMGLSSSVEVLEDYINLLKLEDNIKKGIVKGQISMHNALSLLEFNKEERKRIFNLIVELFLSKNKQKEVITYLKEISRREKILVLDILDEITSILKDSGLMVQEKVEKIRMYLRKRRFPILSAKEQEFEEMKKEIPSNITIKPFPFFEKRGLKFEFEIKNKEELEKIMEKLEKLRMNNRLYKLLNI
jgi:ParB family chromosome partitioning protein